jgi:serine/threonine protein kinase
LELPAQLSNILLGQGTYGRVVLARPAALEGGQNHACKVYDRNPNDLAGARREAFTECLKLAQVGPHPHLVQLVDAGFVGAFPALLFAAAMSPTPTVSDFIKKWGGNVAAIGRTRQIISHVLQGLAHIHAHGYVHLDVKPSNILIDECEAELGLDLRLSAKIADLGMAEPALARNRRCHAAHLGTPAYRAPELLDPSLSPSFDARVDTFAVGIVAFELACGGGSGLHNEDNGNLPQSCRHFLHHTVPQATPTTTRQLGGSGVELLAALLEATPALRLHAKTALEHQYLNPTRLSMAQGRHGTKDLKGHRADFKVACGEVSADQLHQWQHSARSIAPTTWLEDFVRKEPAAAGTSHEDNGTQCVVHGHTAPDGASWPGWPGALPWQSAWVTGFRDCSPASFDRLLARLRDGTRKLPASVRAHENSKHTLEKLTAEDFGAGSQSQFATRTPAVLDHGARTGYPGATVKDMHYDGSNSHLHISATTFGTRDVLFWRENPKPKPKGEGTGLHFPEGAPTPELTLRQRPGQIYVGCVCGPAHQVHHRPECDPPGSDGCTHSLLQFDLGTPPDGRPRAQTHSFALATMFRSALFPNGMFNRLKNRRGSPLELWDLYARTVRRARVTKQAAGASPKGHSRRELRGAAA